MIDAAESLFMDRGFEQTSVSDIVQRVGVAHGLFYYYFDSKEDIIDAIVDRMLQESVQRAEDISRNSSLDALEKMRQFILQMFDIKKSKTYLIGYFLQKKNLLFYHKWVEKSMERITPFLVRIIEQGIEEGYFDTPYPREAWEFIFSGFRFVNVSSVGDIHTLQKKIMAAGDFMERILGAKEGSISSLYREMVRDIESMIAHSDVLDKKGEENGYAKKK